MHEQCGCTFQVIRRIQRQCSIVYRNCWQIATGFRNNKWHCAFVNQLRNINLLFVVCCSICIVLCQRCCCSCCHHFGYFHFDGICSVDHLRTTIIIIVIVVIINDATATSRHFSVSQCFGRLFCRLQFTRFICLIRFIQIVWHHNQLFASFMVDL